MARPVSGQFDLGAFEYSAAVPMQILTTSLPVAFRSRHYNQALQAEGGSGSFVWSVSSGSLPAGLILDPQTGIIRGRPRANSPTAFTVTVADANDATATAVRDLTISVRLHN